MGEALQKAFWQLLPSWQREHQGDVLRCYFFFFLQGKPDEVRDRGLAEAAGHRSRACWVCPGGHEASSLSRALTSQEFAWTILVAVGQVLASLRQGYNLFLKVRSKQSFYLATPQEVVLASVWPLFHFGKATGIVGWSKLLGLCPAMSLS